MTRPNQCRVAVQRYGNTKPIRSSRIVRVKFCLLRKRPVSARTRKNINGSRIRYTVIVVKTRPNQCRVAVQRYGDTKIITNSCIVRVKFCLWRKRPVSARTRKYVHRSRSRCTVIVVFDRPNQCCVAVQRYGNTKLIRSSRIVRVKFCLLRKRPVSARTRKNINRSRIRYTVIVV